MKPLTMRCCRRNLREEGAARVLERQRAAHGDLLRIETYPCLGNCGVCNRGPYCTVNDFLFQKPTPEQLNAFLDGLFGELRRSLREQADSRRRGTPGPAEGGPTRP